MYIHLSLTFLSVLYKHKSLSFVKLSLFLHDVSIFWLGIFIFCPYFRDQPWRYTYFGPKVAFITGIFLKKYLWCMKIHFPFSFFAVWNISPSLLSTIPWKAPASSWSLSELVMFLKIYLWCFGLFDKFQDTKEISM